MKGKTKVIRLVIFIVVVLITTCDIAGAYGGYYTSRGHYTTSYRSRVRWSPYVHGLVSNDLYYSPYAGGLVDRSYYYSPYAFGHGHNGLVSDHYRIPSRSPVVRREIRYQVPEVKSYQPRRRLKQDDPRKVIHDYLKIKGVVNDFITKEVLMVNWETISVTFVFKHKEKDIVIKFWDVQKMSGAVGRRKEYYRNYIAEWEKFWPDYLANGGKIYLITSTSREEIERKLEDILLTCFQ